MTTNLKIDRAKLAEKLAELRSDPSFPTQAKDGLDFWLKDDAKEIHAQPEAELHKVIESIQSIRAGAKAPEHQSVVENAPLPELTYGAGKGASGQIELRIDLAKIRAAVDSPKQVPKNDALWVIPSGVPSRTGDVKKQPVKSKLLMLDFDKMNGRKLQDIQDALYVVAGMPVQHDIYTTHSATKDDPRCRLVLPLSNLLESEHAYRGAVQWLIEELRAQGIECDPLLDTKRLLYLPNHAEGAFYGTLSNREGVCLTTSHSNPVTASSTSLEPTRDPLELILTEQQLADARTVIEAMRAKGLHLSGKGHNLWHRVAAALCIYGTIGEQLFCEFSEGDAEYSEQKCIAKLREKARARVDSGIGALFKIAAEHGIENPATGRMLTTTGKGVAQLATMTVGEHKDAGTNLVAYLFSKLTLTKKDADAMVEAKFWVPDMVVRGHITSYPAPANGGKTTLFIYLCEQMVKEGASVFYINVDSPPDKLKQQHAHAEKHGYKLIAPDSLAGVGIKDAHNVLEHLADSPVSLSNVVIILDTLKKFVPVLDKGEGKAFFNLLRKITSKGASICLLSHTNKYLSNEGALIYEGTGDQRTDIDNMIYIYSAKDPKTGIISLTTEPDKVRAIIKPRSFRIHTNENLRVEECAELLPTITKEERLVLEKAIVAIVGGTATTQKNLLEHLGEETPYGRDKLRAALHNLSEGDAAPLIRKRGQANNALQYSVRGAQSRISDFDQGIAS